MFINFSNHPSKNWDETQLAAANKYGEIVDIPYPQVDAASGEEEIHQMVEDYLAKILEAGPEAIMVCGEYSFAFQMVDALLKHGINVVTAASGRDTIEVINSDGTSTKTSNFYFHKFRKYQYYEPQEHQ